MNVHIVNPLTDNRWSDFIENHSAASVLHTTGWMNALRLTYGYEPLVLTTSEPGQTLTNGIPFCSVKSWITGNRLVSLPFSDHTQPLVDTSEDLVNIISFLNQRVDKQGLKYFEIRPICFDLLHGHNSGVGKSSGFYFHQIDLSRDLQEIYSSFHNTSVRQRIKRAERDGIEVREGVSDELLQQFYKLLLITRRKHQVPPQPYHWFRNVVDCLGDGAKIRVAFHSGTAIASIITLSFRDVEYYKYGCSDPNYAKLSGNVLLIWKAIEEAKERGARIFDMGRSDYSNPSLIEFKDRWGSGRSEISYYRYPVSPQDHSDNDAGFAHRLVSVLPSSLFKLAGRLLYKHFG